MDPEKIANYCIVTRHDAGTIALSRRGNGHGLPVVQLPKPCWLPSEVEALNTELMGQFGLNCTTMRWLRQNECSNLVVMEWHPGSPQPEIDIEWLDPTAAALPLPAEQLQMVRDWREAPCDALLPWEQPGWMQQLVLTLIRTFDGVRQPRLTSLAQFKAAWGMSTLLLIETENGNYFFKTGAKEGVEEYAVIRFLHRQFPHYVRDLVLVDESRNWIVTRQITSSGFRLDDIASVEAALIGYARIQLGSEEFMRTGASSGLRVRDGNWFRAHLERLFSEGACPEEFRQARSFLPQPQLALLRETWLGQIAELEASKLPLTLNQEDFHFGNVLNTAEGPVFIDWADCAKAHPFFSVRRVFQRWPGEDPEAVRLATERVKQAYLEQFSHLADLPALRREFDLAAQLSSLYRAFRWQDRSRGRRQGSPWDAHCFDTAGRHMADAMGLPEDALGKLPATPGSS